MILAPGLLRRSKETHVQNHIAVLVYVFGVIVTLSSSGIMHLADRGSELREIMIRIDHAAIFFLIAATYAPIRIIQFKNYQRWGVLIPIWVLATIGIFLKLFYIDSINEDLSLFFYLTLGWVGVLTFILLLRSNGYKPLIPIFVGAIAFTVGAVIDVSITHDFVEGAIRSHEVFHFFVLVGISSHWLYIQGIV